MHIDYIREMDEHFIDDIEKSIYFLNHNIKINRENPIKIVEEFGHEKLLFCTNDTPQGRLTTEIDFSLFDVITLPSIFLEQIQNGIYRDCKAILDKNGSILIKKGKSILARIVNNNQPYILSRNDIVYKKFFNNGLLPMSFYNSDTYDIILKPSKHVEVYNKKIGQVVYSAYVPTSKDNDIIGKFYSLDYSKVIFGEKDKHFSILEVLNYLKERNDYIYNSSNELDRERKR